MSGRGLDKLHLFGGFLEEQVAAGAHVHCYHERPLRRRGQVRTGESDLGEGVLERDEHGEIFMRAHGRHDRVGRFREIEPGRQPNRVPASALPVQERVPSRCRRVGHIVLQQQELAGDVRSLILLVVARSRGDLR